MTKQEHSYNSATTMYSAGMSFFGVYLAVVGGISAYASRGGQLVGESDHLNLFILAALAGLVINVSQLLICLKCISDFEFSVKWAFAATAFQIISVAVGITSFLILIMTNQV